MARVITKSNERIVVLHPKMQHFLECYGKELGICYEEIELEEEFVYAKINKFVNLIKMNYPLNKMLIIRPKVTTRYLDEDLTVRTIPEEFAEKRRQKATKMLAFTDLLIDELGKDNIYIYDMPNELIADSSKSEVHYLQAAYIRMETEILELLNIDYRKYWEHELQPEELLLEKWIEKCNLYYKISHEVQSEYFDMSSKYFLSLPAPTRLATPKTLLYSAIDTKVKMHNIRNKKVCILVPGKWVGGALNSTVFR